MLIVQAAIPLQGSAPLPIFCFQTEFFLVRGGRAAS
jgi:hypothetical protein